METGENTSEEEVPPTYDPSKDGVGLGCALLSASVLVFGGSILCLVGMNRYHVLDFNRLIPLMGLLLFLFTPLWLWLISLNPASSKLGLPKGKEVVVSLSAATGSMITCMALVFLGNGCGDNTVMTRDVVCVGKRQSWGDDISYYARIRVPTNPERIIDLLVTKEEYDAMYDRQIRLTTGRGNLRLEWIRKQELVDKPR